MSEFIIDDRLPEDPSGIAKAKVGATKGKDLTFVKVGIIAVLVVGAVWFAYSLRGASFELKPGSDGQTLNVPAKKWSATVPNGWIVERGATKSELVMYPESSGDVRGAIRNNIWVRIAWGESDAAPDSAVRQFKDKLDKDREASASLSDVQIGTLVATRSENPSGRISLFVRHDPPLLVTTPKPSAEFEAIVASLRAT